MHITCFHWTMRNFSFHTKWQNSSLNLPFGPDIPLKFLIRNWSLKLFRFTTLQHFSFTFFPNIFFPLLHVPFVTFLFYIHRYFHYIHTNSFMIALIFRFSWFMIMIMSIFGSMQSHPYRLFFLRSIAQFFTLYMNYFVSS